MSMARTFSKFAFISLWDTMNPRNFPETTPKMHLLGFNFIWYCLSVVNVSLRSSRWAGSSLLLMSIHVHFNILLIYLLNILFTNL